MSKKLLAAMIAAAFLSGPQAAADAHDSALSSKEIAAHLDDATRSDADKKRDATRKPHEVLAFMGLAPGMQVLDLYSGGGYYAEILARAVGSQGRVVAHNNQAYLNYAADELTKRFADNRLSGIERLSAENNELKLGESEFDMITMMLAWHDVYYVDEKNGWPRIDGPALLAELFDALKSGGVLAVVDHAATDGAAAEVGQTLHRIDPARLVADITAAGFELDGRSDILRNPDDQHDKPMFDPEVRGKTDRVVLRFRKP